MPCRRVSPFVTTRITVVARLPSPARQRVSVAADVVPHRSGFLALQRAGTARWERRWFLLRRPLLMAFRAKGDAAPQDVLHLHECELVVARAELEFELRQPSSSSAVVGGGGGAAAAAAAAGGGAVAITRVQAANEHDLEQWVAAIVGCSAALAPW